MENSKIPREKIPWYPKIDYSLCSGDKECINFCPHGVYTWNEELKQPIVKNPFECVVGCSNCTTICNTNAISFPSLDDVTELIIQLRESI